MNMFAVIGNVCQPIELRYTPQGTAVCNVAIAHNRKWRDASGNQQENTTYFDITCWGGQAETASKYLKRGDKVAFNGHIEQDTWTDKESGQQRSKIKFVADVGGLHLLPNGRGGQSENQGSTSPTAEPAPATQPQQATTPTQPAQPAPTAAPTGGESFSGTNEEDDIPF